MKDNVKNKDNYGQPRAPRRRAADRLFARPVYLLIVTILSIFLSESFIMLVLPDHQDYSLIGLALLDAMILIVTVFPILYLFILRPVKNHLAQRRLLEQHLQKVRDELELRVKERTAELKRRTGQLARLSSQLTLAEERERHRIASLLHDDLQQLLVAARMNLDVAEKSPEHDRPGIYRRLRALIENSIDASRSLAVDLSPPLLYKKGLAAALKWQAISFREKHGLKVTLQADPQADPGQEDVSVLLFASVRELLFNVVKHAGVDTASVRMGRDESGRLKIEVADTGVGFDKEKISADSMPTGFGLFTIQERLELLGGSLQVESAPGRGSTFTLVVPV